MFKKARRQLEHLKNRERRLVFRLEAGIFNDIDHEDRLLDILHRNRLAQKRIGWIARLLNWVLGAPK